MIALTNTLDNMMMNNDILRMRLAERVTEVRERFSMDRIRLLWETLFEESLHERQ